MNNVATSVEPHAGGHSGGLGLRPSVGNVRKLARALTPDLRQDPRVALRDSRVRDPLRRTLLALAPDTGLTFEDGDADDPYADADGNTLRRRFSVLRAARDETVLLQIPDWVANDGSNVGALDEMRDVFVKRKVRIVAEGVEAPSLSLQKTLPRIWQERAKSDVEFVSWRYVRELLEGKLTPRDLFDLRDGPGPAGPPQAAPKAIKSVFIGSTGLDLREYREAARDICLRRRLMPIMMEYFEVMGRGATDGSKKKLEQADLYVGIFAHRYGFIEPGHDRSVTELEFNYAGERNLERLCFLVDPAHPWSPEHWDPEHREQMMAFKRRIESKLIRGQFSSVDSFKLLLMQALDEVAARQPTEDNGP